MNAPKVSRLRRGDGGDGGGGDGGGGACVVKSYTGGSMAIGKVSHLGQVESDDPHKKEYPGPSSRLGGWSVKLTTSSP